MNYIDLFSFLKLSEKAILRLDAKLQKPAYHQLLLLHRASYPKKYKKHPKIATIACLTRAPGCCYISR
jgi:hypothetical protein